MVYPENRYLFTMKDICHACGVSRATLLRMEEAGFLVPNKVDENTGYRYYDADNIAQIGQYYILQQVGLSRNEITDVYLRHFDADSFVVEQQKQIEQLQRALNKFEIIYTKNKDRVFTFEEMPEVTCYCDMMSMVDFANTETKTFELYQQLIKDGFQMNGVEPLFAYMHSVSEDSFDMFNPENQIEVCIPILPTSKVSDHIKTFPAFYAFSYTAYGGYSVAKDAQIDFLKEVSSRNIKITGPIRLIAHVAAYSGAHISSQDFCIGFAAPVERNE